MRVISRHIKPQEGIAELRRKIWISSSKKRECHFKPDLLILDIMMPDINGYEVCQKVKSNPETKDTKIIVLSAYLDDEAFKQMKEYGADACFSKPLPLEQLKIEVAKLLGLKE